MLGSQVMFNFATPNYEVLCDTIKFLYLSKKIKYNKL